MHALRRPAFTLLASMLPLAVQAQVAHYQLDPVHTRVLFAVSHAGFSQALGTVSGSHGELWFDPGDWSGARLVVEVPLERLDMGDAKWTKAVLAPNLLNAGDYPVVRFVSRRIEPRDATHARVCGDLALHGVTRDTCLDVTFNQLERHPMPPFRRTAGFSATATLKRADFGIDAWKALIGNEVQLRIEAEAVPASAARDGHSDKADGAPPPAGPIEPDQPDPASTQTQTDTTP